MEIRLSNNSQLIFSKVKPDLLSVELWQPGRDRGGHGWLLQGSAVISGEELKEFLDGLRPEEGRRPA